MHPFVFLVLLLCLLPFLDSFRFPFHSICFLVISYSTSLLSPSFLTSLFNTSSSFPSLFPQSFLFPVSTFIQDFLAAPLKLSTTPFLSLVKSSFLPRGLSFPLNLPRPSSFFSSLFLVALVTHPFLPLPSLLLLPRLLSVVSFPYPSLPSLLAILFHSLPCLRSHLQSFTLSQSPLPRSITPALSSPIPHFR